MAYIANKPIRFDRDYKVGEIIPDSVIDPAAEKRLIAWGKITKTDAVTGSIQSAEKTAKRKSR